MHTTRFSLQRNAQKGRADLRKVLYSKRNNFNHTVSAAKPSVVTALMNVSMSQLHDSTVQATKLGELDRDGMVALLKQLRTFHRRDRADVVVRAYQEAGRALSPHHYTILMSHASDDGDWSTSLRLFSEASQSGKVRPQTHGALLSTLTRRGMWKDAVTHFNHMVNDRIPVDNHALHVLMNATRKESPWKTSIQVFSTAVNAGTTPNALVYLVLLRCLSQSQLPSRWHYALSFLSKLQGRVERNAGMYNAVMETLGSCGRWEKAVDVFHSMPTDGVLPSNDTMRTVMTLNKKNAVHVVKSLAATHALSMPVTSQMYRMVFRALIAAGKPDQVKIVANSEMSRSATHAGNPNNSIEAVSHALVDCALFLTDPVIASDLVQSFEPQVESVLPQACAGLVLLGEPSQRWVADDGCRVAVVDHNTIRHKHFETLLAHYDHVLIPATAVRILISRGEDTSFGGTYHSSHNEWVLSRLRSALHNPANLRRWKKQHDTDGSDSIAASFHVVPLYHQLHAHSFLSTRNGTASEESLKLLRKSSAEIAADALLKLAASSVNNGDDDEETISGIRPTSSPDTNTVTTTAPADDPLHSNQQNVAVPPFTTNPFVLQVSESMVSVAVMLKTLNPAASVHLVSPSRHLLNEGRRWNQHATLYSRGEIDQQIELVHFPDELHQKAPSVLQSERTNESSSAAGSAISISKNQLTLHRMPRRDHMFIPS